MALDLSTIEKVIVAAVANPNFFCLSENSEEKAKRVTDLIKEVDKTVKEK